MFESVLRIRDVYPGPRILIFTHPGSRIQKQQQKRGVKKIVILFCSHKFHKIEYYFIFEMLWKKFGPVFKEFYPKKFHYALKYIVWDPGSGKSYPGSRGPKGIGSRIRIRNTGCRYARNGT
jgi:hypothetical protein